MGRSPRRSVWNQDEINWCWGGGQLLTTRTGLAIELSPVMQDEVSYVMFQKAVPSNSYHRCLIVGTQIVTNSFRWSVVILSCVLCPNGRWKNRIDACPVTSLASSMSLCVFHRNKLKRWYLDLNVWKGILFPQTGQQLKQFFFHKSVIYVTSEVPFSIGLLPRSTGLAEIKMVSGRKNVLPQPWLESFSTFSTLSGGETRSVSSVDSDSKYLVIGCPKPSDFGIVERDGFLGIDRTLVNSRVIKEEFAVFRKHFMRNGFFFDGQRLKPSKLIMQKQPSKPKPIVQPSKPLTPEPLNESVRKEIKKKKLVHKKGIETWKIEEGMGVSYDNLNQIRTGN